MNPKYALFIWGSYALTMAVLAWNLIAPTLRRNELRRDLEDSSADEALESTT